MKTIEYIIYRCNLLWESKDGFILIYKEKVCRKIDYHTKRNTLHLNPKYGPTSHLFLPWLRIRVKLTRIRPSRKKKTGTSPRKTNQRWIWPLLKQPGSWSHQIKLTRNQYNWDFIILKEKFNLWEVLFTPDFENYSVRILPERINIRSDLIYVRSYVNRGGELQ